MKCYRHRQKPSKLQWLRGLRISVGIALLAALIAFESAQANDDIVPGSRFTPARAQAMGNAYLPLADDTASALFYNPANLGLNRGAQGDFFNLEMYGDSGYFNGMDTGHHDFYKVTNLGSFDSTLQRNPGTWQGVGYSFAPSMGFKGFGVGVLVQEQVRAKYNSNNNTVDYSGNYQLIPTAGYALRLAEGIVRIGYSIQWVNEATGNVTGISAANATGYNQGLEKGSGFSHTLGVAITLPYQHLPQLNVVGRNLFMTRYTSTAIMPFAQGSNGTPGNEPTSFDASLSLVEKIGAGAEFTWVLEDRDATDTSGVSILGRVALGMEFDFRHAFFLRGGWGDGYPNGGIGFRRKSGDLSVSWTNVEIGNGYHDQRDTRWVLQYQVRAF